MPLYRTSPYKWREVIDRQVNKLDNSSPVLNISDLYPRPDGAYHTLTTAIAEVPNRMKKPGLKIMYMSALDIVSEYQFTGSDISSFSNEAKWASPVDASVYANDALAYRDAAAAIVSGGPRGTYANLAALIAANPDHLYTYITIDNGYWNYWNGAEFVAGGLYQSPQASDVLANHTNSTPRVTTGTNILNTAANVVQPLRYINTDGALLTTTFDYTTSNYLEWGAGTAAYFGKNGVLANAYRYAQYNSAFTFIAGSYGSNANTISKVAGAVYFRITWSVATINQVNLGSGILAFEAFSKRLLDTPLGEPVTFRPDMSDATLAAKLALMDSLTTGDNEKIIEAQRNGGSTYIQTARITPSPASLWNSTSGYNNKWYQIFYKGKTSKSINRISIPLVRDLSHNLTFTDAITVKIFHSGRHILTRVIALAELATYNALTAASPVASFFYNIDIPTIFFDLDEVLYVGVECNAATDKLAMIYSMNTAGEGSEWTSNLTNSGDTVGTVLNITAQPSAPTAAAFYRVMYCSFCDYIADQIRAGGVEKTTETTIAPTKIYTVCNDIIQTNLGFSSRNYSACLYVDHFLKLSTKKKAYFDSTLNDKLPVSAPIAIDNASYNGGSNVNTATVTDTIKGELNDIAVSVSHISTRASVADSAFPKILCIGTSVTNKFLANVPIAETANNPDAYFAYIKKLFQLDKIDKGSGHDCLMIGKNTSREFVVGGSTIRSFAEGRGGWTTRNYLYDATSGGYTNYFYDSAKPTVKFSLAKYLANYKTLADDGVTRLEVGTTAGALVTDVNAHDICTPTHVVLELGFNDVEGNYAADMALLIAEIKAEYPNMIIIVVANDAAGTYYPELYPAYNGNNLLADSLHTKMWNLTTAAKALENVGNKVFYCPTYFIQPTGIATAFRNTDFPESLANADFKHGTLHGAGTNYHPNTYAHAAWGYQIYSLIMYTLTL